MSKYKAIGNYYNEDGLDKTIKFNTSNLDGSEFD